MTGAATFGLLTMLAWGFWIVFGNVASNSIDPKLAAFLSYLTAAVVTGLYLLVADTSFAITHRGLLFAAAAGVAAAVGVISTFIGVTVGPTSIVATIGGMYFVTAAGISILVFGEPVTSTKVAGFGFAIVAVVLLTQ